MGALSLLPLSVRQLLQYWWCRTFHPELLPFADEGLGIEARARRCARFWAPHLRLAREFSTAAFSHNGGEGRERHTGIAVLGAGRLLDLDLTALLKHTASVLLIDADPTAAAAQRRVIGSLPPELRSVPVRIQCEDVTGGSIAQGISRVRELSVNSSGRSAQETATTLRCIVTELQAEHRMYADCSGVLSLNLLGQLPLPFLREVTALVQRWFPDLVADDESLRGPFAPFEQLVTEQLQRLHLEALFRPQSRRTVTILSDQEFYFYERNSSPWMVVPALRCDVAKVAAKFGYRSVLRDSWLWHLSPQGVEQSEYGSIHQIGGWSFVRDPG